MDYIPRKTRKMNITEKITVPLIESRYLSAENADRYRSIMRLFYLHYEKMRYWLYQEEIFEELKAEPYFAVHDGAVPAGLKCPGGVEKFVYAAGYQKCEEH